MRKNVAGQTIGAQMITAADGSAFTGAVVVRVTIDHGTQSGTSATVHKGQGYHSYTPAQADTNGDHIAFTFTGTGAIPVSIQVYTAMDANVIQWLTDVPNVLVTGRVDARVGAMSGGVINAGAFSTDAIDDNALAASAVSEIASAIPTASENATTLLDLANGVETGLTMRQALRASTASLFGKLSGAATTTVAIRNIGDSLDRITATVDADGNRSAVTLNLT